MSALELKIRSYQPGDEEAIVVLWNQCFSRDPVTLEVFVKQVLLDVNFDPDGMFVAEVQGKVVGCLLAVVRKLPLFGNDLEENNGWISFLGVHLDYQRAGIGTQLLNAAEEFFINSGRTVIGFSPYAPNYFLPGADKESYPEGFAFLEKHGFQVLYTAAAMDKNLVDYVYPKDVADVEASLAAKSYHIQSLQYRNITNLLSFITKEFNPDWTRAVREGLVRGLPFDHVLVALYGEDIVGFCMFGGYGNVGERFGPFGVSKSLRGTGLGKVLLYRCLTDMKAQGLHGAWFLWTGEEEPAGHLYHRANFTTTRKFEVMEKTLN